MCRLFCFGMTLLITSGHGIKTNSTRENPTAGDVGQEIVAWILEGSTWKIVLLIAAGIFLLTLLILTIYRISLKCQHAKRQPEDEKTADITVPQECTFMSRRSAGTVPTAEVHDCTDQKNKPQLRSKLLRTFTNDEGKTRYSFGVHSQHRSHREGGFHQEVPCGISETPNMSSANKSTNGFFSRWKNQEKPQEPEVIYQNQQDIQSSLRQEYSSHKMATSNAEPVYENSQNILTQQGFHNPSTVFNQPAIYQNSNSTNSRSYHTRSLASNEMIAHNHGAGYHHQQQNLSQSDDALDYINAAPDASQSDDALDYMNAAPNSYQSDDALDYMNAAPDASQSDDALDYMNLASNTYSPGPQCSIGYNMTPRAQNVHASKGGLQESRRNAARRSKSNVESIRMKTLPLPPPSERRRNHSYVNKNWHIEKAESFDWGYGLGHQTKTQGIMNALGTNQQRHEWQESGQFRQQNYPRPLSTQRAEPFGDYDDIRAYRT